MSLRSRWQARQIRRGGETVFPRETIVERVELEARVLAHFTFRQRYPYGLVLWGDWTWSELPSPSSQMWPTSYARRA